MPEILTLERLCAQGPDDAPVLLAAGRPALDYAGLREQIRRTVQRLNVLGIGRSDRIAIVLPNAPEAAVAFLAVASAAAAAPLDPDCSEHEFEILLAALAPKVLLVELFAPTPARMAAARLGIPIVELAARPAEGAGRFDLIGAEDRDSARLAGFGGPDQVALLLYVLRAGRPRLVPLTQANLCISAANIRRSLRLTSSDRCLNALPLCRSHGLVGVLLASIAATGSVWCLPRFEAQPFFAALDAARVTWTSALPAMHAELVEHAPAHAEIVAQRPLRFIRTSSAALPPVLLQQLEQTFACPVIEAYGKAEAAHQISANPLPPQPRKAGTVGIAAGPQVAVLDANNRMLPPNAIGEVCVRGRSVTAGYLDEPAANETAFAGGWFHTGDLGSMDADGYLTLAGAVRGEPGEREQALAGQPANSR
jgi:acyl-CoA synthetase (AMP-forming)/AMP-acid ligase II